MMQSSVAAQLAIKDSPLQRRLLAWLRPRIEMSQRHMSQRYPAWRESEQLTRSYREPDAEDDARRRTPLTEGVRKIVVPYPYAVMQSVLAFFMTVFTQRKPIIPVEGSGPVDVRAALLMELALDYQGDNMEPTFVLALFQLLQDAGRYGVGVIKNTWAVREWPDLRRTFQPIIDPFTGKQVGIRDSVQRENVTAYEGNQNRNVSPFDWLPDPRRPFCDFQRGEFCGDRFRLSWLDARQRAAQGLYAGIEFIPRSRMTSPWEGSYGFGAGANSGESDLNRIIDMAETGTEPGAGEPYIDGVELYAFCNPGELGLAGDFAGDDMPPMLPEEDARDTSVPGLWVFTVCNGTRVVRAEPAFLPGRRFPYECSELNYDWHSPANAGLVESFKDLSYHLSWLFNSRMLSVERTINNESLYDPSLVEEMDLLAPGPGRLVRLKEQAQGAGVMDNAIQQLQVQDVTQGHHNDSAVITDLIEVVTGANRLIMGLPNQGRRAATEVQGQLNLASGRMKMLVELVSQQCLRPLARQMARNTQTFASEFTMNLKAPYDRILGAPFIRVTPDMLQGEFSFPFTEMGMPTDKLFEANVWKELLMQFMQAGAGPMLASQLPMPQMMLAMWGRFLHGMGVKDLQTFGVTIPQMAVGDPMQMMQQVQQGNLVPADAGGGPPQFGGGGSPPAPSTLGMTPTDGFARPSAAETPSQNGKPVLQ